MIEKPSREQPEAFDDRQALHEVTSAMLGYVTEMDEAGWNLPTPCAKWNVRALIRHVVRGHARMEGNFAVPPFAAPAPSPTEFDRDRVGALRMWTERALACLEEPGVMNRAVRHRALGEMTGRAYTRVRWVDVVVHTWDLGQALGKDYRPSRALAETGLLWALSNHDQLAASGAFAGSVDANTADDPFVKLLVELGRSPCDPLPS